MGIVNATPDSFSDGGAFFAPDMAIAHGKTMIAAGAAIVDVGGESTRPGAERIDPDEEMRRVLPVIVGLSAAAQQRVRRFPSTPAMPERCERRSPPEPA